MPIDVSYYGIHTTDHGIAFLEQQKTPRDGYRREFTSTNALGQKLISPFRVRSLGKLRDCNHDIRINEAAPSSEQMHAFCEIVEQDELLRAVLPVPRTPAWLVFTPQWPGAFEVMLELAKMSSPVQSPVKSFLNMRPNDMLAECEMTNVQPLILLDAESLYMEKLKQLASGHRGKPRNVVVLGRPDMLPPPPFRTIQTTLNTRPLSEIISLPWERIGGTVVRKYMRGEWHL